MFNRKGFIVKKREIDEMQTPRVAGKRTRFDFAAGRIPPVKPEIVSQLLQEAKNWTFNHLMIEEAERWCPFPHCVEKQIQTTKDLAHNLSSTFKQDGSNSASVNQAWEQLGRDAQENPATRDLLRFLATHTGYPSEHEDDIASDYEEDHIQRKEDITMPDSQQETSHQQQDTQHIESQQRQNVFYPYLDVKYRSDEEGFWEASGPPLITEQVGLQQRRDISLYSQPVSDRFGNQKLTEIFPQVNLDHITDSVERNAYQAVLSCYAQKLQDKAKQMYSEIFHHYQDSEIYYKWYGVKKELNQMIVLYDEQNDKVSISPSKNLLYSQLGVNTFISTFNNKNMQYVNEHIQSNKPVQWAMYKILKPFYKQKEEYTIKENNEVKQGPIGLYLTDNYARLAQDFGGTHQIIPKLYHTTNIHKTTGPWTLPNGAVREQPQIHTGKKPKYGDVFKFETPEEPS